MTCELAEVLNEFITKFDIDVGRNELGRRDKNDITKLSGREYVAIRSGIDPKTLYKILKNQTVATDFGKADIILCSIEMQGEFNDRVEIHEGELRWASGKDRKVAAPSARKMNGKWGVDALD